MIRGLKVRDRETGKVGFVSDYYRWSGTTHECKVLFLDGSFEDYTWATSKLELYDTGLYELEASIKQKNKDQASRQQHADKYL